VHAADRPSVRLWRGSAVGGHSPVIGRMSQPDPLRPSPKQVSGAPREWEAVFRSRAMLEYVEHLGADCSRLTKGLIQRSGLWLDEAYGFS
jgi:hypothetical protein